MLEDYRRYITNIRNGLIQCGVEYPISPLESYRDIFNACIELDELLWYYSILAISGSEYALKDYILPLNGYYLEKMRSLFYKEFLSFVGDYRKLSKTNVLLNSIKEKSDKQTISLEEGTLSSYNSQESEELYNEDEEIELYSPEEVNSYSEKENIFEIEKENIDKSSQNLENMVEYSTKVGTSEYSPHGTFLEDLEFDSKVSNEEYSSHGVYLEDLVFDEQESNQLKDEEYSPHGLYIEDMFFEEVQEYNEENEYSPHGTYIEDIQVEDEEVDLEELINEDYSSQLDENDFEISYEEEKYEDGGDLLELDDSSDDIMYDENGFEISYESDVLEEDSEDLEGLYDENGFEINYEEDSSEEESSDDIMYDENGFEINYEEEELLEESSDDDMYDENGFEISYDESETIDEYEEGLIEESYKSDSQVEDVHNSTEHITSSKDLSDYMQDITNAVLTKGKKAIIKEFRKLSE